VTLSTVNTTTIRETREMAPKLAEEIAKLRKEVEQLRRESDLNRIPVSSSVAELIAYVKENTKVNLII